MVVAEVGDIALVPAVPKDRARTGLGAAHAGHGYAEAGGARRDARGVVLRSREEKLVVVATGKEQLDGIEPLQLAERSQARRDGKLGALEDEANARGASEPAGVDADAVRDVDRGGGQALAGQSRSEADPGLRVAIRRDQAA